jgi:hypothetical protein
MRENPRKYTLILGACPKRLGENWLVGSVIAHLVQCETSGKAFWLCPFRMRGVREEDKNRLTFSKNAFFYDALEGKISWKFKVEKDFDGNHFSDSNERKKYKRYFGFRERSFEYGKKWLQDRRWFLISNIQKLKRPFNKTPRGHFPDFRVYTYGKEKPLRVSDFEHNTVFAFKAPEVREKDLEKVLSDDLLDRYLKQFFLIKSPNKTLREWAIQSAFALKLMKEKKWDFWPEKPVGGKRGRIDVLFKEKKKGISLLLR